jgi:hypothetical protein
LDFTFQDVDLTEYKNMLLVYEYDGFILDTINWNSVDENIVNIRNSDIVSGNNYYTEDEWPLLVDR